MATSDYLTFSAAGGANVISQAAYAALSARSIGFSTGVAPSAQLNKAWRQSSVIAAMIGKFTADATSTNVVDDGDVAALQALFTTALINSVTGGTVFATLAEILAKNNVKPVTAGGLFGVGSFGSLTDAANIAWDAQSTTNKVTTAVTLGGNRNLNAISNLSDGQDVCLAVTQDGTGNRTLTFAAQHKFPNNNVPTLNGTAGSTAYLFGRYRAATSQVIWGGFVQVL